MTQQSIDPNAQKRERFLTAPEAHLRDIRSSSRDIKSHEGIESIYNAAQEQAFNNDVIEPHKQRSWKFFFFKKKNKKNTETKRDSIHEIELLKTKIQALEDDMELLKVLLESERATNRSALSSSEMASSTT